MFSLEEKYIDIHSHNITFDDSVFQILNLYPDFQILNNTSTKYSMGLHPWYVDDTYKEKLELLEIQLQQPEIIAIGECGLDKVCKTSYKTQLLVFEKQIILSEKFNKPLIIHCVKSIDELLQLMRNIKSKKIIHGFNGNITMFEQLINSGFYISIGANIFTNHKIQELIKQIPLEYLFLESDDKANTIKSVYRKVCELRNIEFKELQNRMINNFNTIWNIG